MPTPYLDSSTDILNAGYPVVNIRYAIHPDPMAGMIELSALFRTTAERQGVEGIEIARKLGLSQSMVSDILNGKKKNTLPPEILKGFGRVLGISQVQMMVALGYVDADQDTDPWNATLPPDVRAVLADIDWSQPIARSTAMPVLGMIRDVQRGTLPVLHDPSEVDRKPPIK